MDMNSKLTKLNDLLDRQAWHALWLAFVKEPEISAEFKQAALSHPHAPEWLKEILLIRSW